MRLFECTLMCQQSNAQPYFKKTLYQTFTFKYSKTNLKARLRVSLISY
jgi:hypothetical protein